ncbi:MAG: DbpA RNA binding domain-containing protein [Propionibacteriaceae bacterium]|nr:DbpA RNA binding domain-containing protein [Propionibacteriaceae bacterium]
MDQALSRPARRPAYERDGHGRRSRWEDDRPNRDRARAKSNGHDQSDQGRDRRQPAWGRDRDQPGSRWEHDHSRTKSWQRDRDQPGSSWEQHGGRTKSWQRDRDSAGPSWQRDQTRPGQGRRAFSSDQPDRGGADRRSDDGTNRYWVGVGHAHGTRPGAIVGALTGESGLRGSDLGRIDMFGRFSLVEIKPHLSQDTLRRLARAKVAGRPLQLRPDAGQPGRGGRPGRG